MSMSVATPPPAGDEVPVGDEDQGAAHGDQLRACIAVWRRSAEVDVLLVREGLAQGDEVHAAVFFEPRASVVVAEEVDEREHGVGLEAVSRELLLDGVERADDELGDVRALHHRSASEDPNPHRDQYLMGVKPRGADGL
jgi:hypothetical protein